MFTPRSSRSHLRPVPSPQRIAPTTECPPEPALADPLHRALADGGWLGDHVRDLAAQVGGGHALESIDDEPLPDEPFDWSAVPPEHHELARQVIDLADAACECWADHEIRTVVRRLWARIVAAQPVTFRRMPDPQRLAAAVVWLAMKGNGALGGRRGVTASLLWSHFRVGSCTDLGRALLGAAGLRNIELERRLSSPSGQAVVLPDPALLTSRHRAQLRRQRDHAVQAAEQAREHQRASAPFVVRDDGRLEVRMLPVSPPQFCLKVAMGGPAPMLAVGFGNAPSAPDRVIGLTIADARRLIALLDEGIRAEPSATRL